MLPCSRAVRDARKEVDAAQAMWWEARLSHNTDLDCKNEQAAEELLAEARQKLADAQGYESHVYNVAFFEQKRLLNNPW